MPLAEVIVYWGEDPWPYDVLSEHLPAATRLRWLQSCSAGVEKLCAVFTAHRPASESVIVTNAKGVYGPVLAEHALFCCLHFSRRYPYFEANRQARLWQSFSPYSLRGQTLAIVGFGLSGLEIARLAHAFGMRVEVLRSTLVDEMAKEERDELIGFICAFMNVQEFKDRAKATQHEPYSGKAHQRSLQRMIELGDQMRPLIGPSRL